MKAIIIAAGMGKRMRPITDSIPKCLLDINGKSLLALHIEAMRSCGIGDIAVVRGHLADKIQIEGPRYYTNDRYEENNILNSLFYAEKEMDDDVVIVYSDICYRKEILEKLISSPYRMSVVVDLAWRDAYSGRSDHPIEEAESVKIGSDMKVVKIGKKINKDTADGEFIGMMRLSREGCAVFRELFNRSKKNFWGKPFHEAANFEKAYLTDMIQEVADNGIDVHCVTVNGGWKELDTVQDYNNLRKAAAAV